jgi:hypothetical protein
MLIGTVSETYRTCGTPSCRCHTTGPKHGPHQYVSYKGDHGRTTGYYVRKALQERVLGGLEAWKEFQALAKQVAELNKEIMEAEHPPQRRAKRKTNTKA